MNTSVRISTHDHAAARSMTYDENGAYCTTCGQRWLLVHGETQGKNRLVPQEYSGSHNSERVTLRST